MSTKGRKLNKIIFLKKDEGTLEGFKSPLFSQSEDRTPAQLEKSAPSQNDLASDCANLSTIPSWYHPLQRKRLKKEYIQHLADNFKKPITYNNKEIYTPTQKEIEEYIKDLKTCKIQQLQQMQTIMKYPLKLEFLDRIKSLKKKEHAIVTIFNDNKTTDTGIIHCYDRTFSRHEMTYLIMNDRGIYDPEFKMIHFYYYANNPFPLVYDKSQSKMPEAVADAKLMDDTIEMKVIEALAAVDIDKKINLLMLFSVLNLCMSAITLLLIYKAGKT